MKKIVICGIGALGSNLANNLAADNKDLDFYLLDYQDVEARNIQAYTQAYVAEQIGMPKTKALRINLFQRYKVRANIINTKLKRADTENAMISLTLLQNFDLIIDCLDNYDGRKMLTNFSKDNRKDCIHLGFSPQMTYQIAWNEGYEPEGGNEEIDICELEGAASFVRFVAALGSSVILEYIKSGKKINMVGNRFGIRRLG